MTIFSVALLCCLIFWGCNNGVNSGAPDAGITVDKLRCEYHSAPLGIDVAKPRLSWIVQSAHRGQKQMAYHILVADSKAKLDENTGNLWDSGKVDSDETTGIVYRGKPLTSHLRCYWKIKVWDKDGQDSKWSKPAMWSMGLLNPNDWQAKWIGFDAPTPVSHQVAKDPDSPVSLSDCSWVWFPQGNPPKSAPVGTCFFRRVFTVPNDKKIKQAKLYLCVDNDLILSINGTEVTKFSGWAPPRSVDVTEKLQPGTNILAIAAHNVGDNDNPAGLLGKLILDFETGPELAIKIDKTFKVSNVQHPDWHLLAFDDNDWQPAQEFAQAGAAPWGDLGHNDLVLSPPPYLRKTFSLQKTIARATIYASALGLYEFHLNGQRVGKDYFTPGWTDYNKRVYYQTYDVTDLIQPGNNVLGAILADGWYSGHVGWGRKRDHYGDKPRLLAQLVLEFNDGTTQTIATDKSWKAAYGPLLEADFLMGETYDARLELPGWDTAAFNDSSWNNVDITEKIDVLVQAYPGVTVRNTKQIKPLRLTEPKPGTFVFDLGQNIAGFAHLKVKGPRSDKIVLRFAEILNPDGTLYTTNLRQARCIDKYIFKGDGIETFQPRFTFHGFRYIEVTGYPGTPPLDAVTGIVVHSDTPVAGSFACSSKMVNQLYSNITWGQRGNFIEVPTDCPQRDERLGWTGDAQIFVRTATCNMDVAAFFTKWFVDLEDAQGPEGDFPDVAPRVVATGGGTAAWGDAGVICPWTIYHVYNDTRLIEKHYSAMVRWIEYLKNNSVNLLRPAQGYGDWVSIASDTPKDVIATAYFARSTQLVSKMAAAIGKTEDAKKYEDLFQRIKLAFNQAYVTDDGRIKGNTQTCYLLGLHFDLLPEDKRPLAAAHLVERIEAKNWHLSTGFVGLGHLLPTLTEIDRNDVAYRLLNNETFPSWGYSIKHGATTIWERWDGWTEEKGFQDPGMNSFNHYSFGSVGKWLFSTVAGIDTDGPGFKQIIIKPQPGGNLTYATATYDSINGPIVSDWKLDNKKFKLNVTIPANTTATVYIPTKSPDAVTESGKKIENAESVKFIKTEAGHAVYKIGSGNYTFESAQ
ncbi:MAG: family 78 glycoside hydrolase catalytic domain [Sedimentisphaerales bacterium]|nr:family 78 glycoside hydrolase catalytic domain [Sedimentisphaerales bacterium]